MSNTELDFFQNKFVQVTKERDGTMAALQAAAEVADLARAAAAAFAVGEECARAEIAAQFSDDDVAALTRAMDLCDGSDTEQCERTALEKVLKVIRPIGTKALT